MEFFSKKERLLVIAIALVAILMLGVKTINNKATINEQPILSIADESNEDELDKNEPLEELYVHISGEVNSPGLYLMSNGDRVVDVVEKAGGLTQAADPDKINLAKKVYDEEKLYIPSIDDSNEQIVVNGISSSQPTKININSANQTELESLPGVGPATAQKIITYRQTQRFLKIEDIMNVNGIGQAKFDSMKDYIIAK